MHISIPLPALLAATFALLPITAATTTSSTADYASACYTSPLPSLTPSTANRTIPWGQPSFILPNGTTCCTSLTQVRAGIDEIDAQLLELLAQRAAYVREATRFKATLDAVNVPSRNEAVIEGAVKDAMSTKPRLPEVVARGVFEAIINASVPFEYCVYESFKEGVC